MKNNRIRISIIIPTYKGSDVITRAVDSVLAQEVDCGFEVIVVDDNDPSSYERKATETAMQSYSNEERVVYIRHDKNKNGAAARNTGFAHSRGEYICFLDDDDIFLPTKLKKQILYMDSHPEFGASYTWRLLPHDELVSYSKTGDLSEELLLLKFTPTTITIMIKRECYEALGGHDENFRRHQDFEFQLRFFQRYKIGVVNEPLSKIIGGANNNQLHGKKLEDLKKYFFESLDPLIDNVDQRNPGFRKCVYAKHYSEVFKDHIKTKNYYLALRLAISMTRCCALNFWVIIIKDILISIKRRVLGK